MFSAIKVFLGITGICFLFGAPVVTWKIKNSNSDEAKNSGVKDLGQSSEHTPPVPSESAI